MHWRLSRKSVGRQMGWFEARDRDCLLALTTAEAESNEESDAGPCKDLHRKVRAEDDKEEPR